MQDFSTRTYGKWILAGEHAVLRGCPALAFPLKTRYLELEYFADSKTVAVEFRGPHGEELKLLFYGVIENALSRLNVCEPLQGRFVLTNWLPVGSGLGASAALCGAVARWCEAQGWVKAADVYELACRLEDLFHGESSGVDVAVSLLGKGLRFVRGQEMVPLDMKWWPRFYLSSSGQRGVTADCVSKVKRLFEADLRLARELDEQMRESVHLAERAFAQPESEGLPMLKRALDLGRDCFERWDLCGGELSAHIQQLEQAGAWAIKPTGSGGGGYVLSLWQEMPPAEMAEHLIPVSFEPSVYTEQAQGQALR